MRNKFNQIPKPKPKAKVGVTAVNPAVTKKTADLLQQGLALHNAGQLEQARVIYEEILKLNPKHFDALQLSGTIAAQTKQWDKALELLTDALKINTTNASVYNNRGVVLKELKRLDEALTSYDRAIELKRDYAEAYSNRGIVLKELKRFDEALTSYDRAIELKRDYAEAYWNKSIALLLQGDFIKGFNEYEWRWINEESSKVGGKRTFRQALWLGKESLANKTILLYSEQGLGDSIQFCRYAKLVKSLGARVLLEVPKHLVALLHELEGVDLLIENGKPLPNFDYQCPLMSLPLAFKTELNSIPSTSAYLKSNAAKLEVWSKRLGEKSKMRIGLVWSGSTGHKNDHNRSLSLTDVLKHLPPNFEYVSLQKEVREGDKEALTNSAIKHYGNELNDFTDTAALCDLMDIVISVDTSVAHLAGALGKTTWILLPYVPDWRWLLDRDDSPWYESVKLYRQDEDRQYAPVLERVANDLLKISSIT